MRVISKQGVRSERTPISVSPDPYQVHALRARSLSLSQGGGPWTISDVHFVELNGSEQEIVAVCEQYVIHLTRLVQDFIHKHPEYTSIPNEQFGPRRGPREKPGRGSAWSGVANDRSKISSGCTQSSISKSAGYLCPGPTEIMRHRASLRLVSARFLAPRAENSDATSIRPISEFHRVGRVLGFGLRRGIEHGPQHARDRSSCRSPGQELAQARDRGAIGHGAVATGDAIEPVRPGTPG
jgi:hypothetical protein